MPGKARKVTLGVNVDHVATLRQARFTTYPSPVEAALLAKKGGADQITVHLREDRRHIQEDDVKQVAKKVALPLNLEMALTPEMVDFALKIKPRSVTLVPERRQELTTEGGLNVKACFNPLGEAIERFRKKGIWVSLFIDPDDTMVELCSILHADFIELHTGDYALSTKRDQPKEYKRLESAARYALDLGLRINAGHGLNYDNLGLIKKLPGLEELNIGHAIVSRAVLTGMEEAVAAMKKLIQ